MWGAFDKKNRLGALCNRGKVPLVLKRKESCPYLLQTTRSSSELLCVALLFVFERERKARCDHSSSRSRLPEAQSRFCRAKSGKRVLHYVRCTTICQHVHILHVPFTVFVILRKMGSAVLHFALLQILRKTKFAKCELVKFVKLVKFA